MTPAIVGIGQTAVGVVPHLTADDLYLQAATEAIADSGLGPGDVDGVITANSRVAPYQNHAEALAEKLGIGHRFALTLQTGGANTLRAIQLAVDTIAARRARAVLVAAADNLHSAWTRGDAVRSLAETGYREFEEPYGVFAPALFALVATRHMAVFGSTVEQLAQVAVTMRDNASRTPGAHFRDRLSVANVLASPLIASPLRRLDCAPISDGGAAVVVADPREVRVGHEPPVSWAAYDERHQPTLPYADDIVQRPALRAAVDGALAQAGVALSDIDLLLVYDPFTIETIVSLEAIGLCNPGDGGRLVENGHISMDGPLPLNPHGGLLSFGHPGRAGAMLHLVEGVRQLRGSALPESRRLPDPEFALLTAEGAMLSTYAVAVLARMG